jgi:hypothetical protein
VVNGEYQAVLSLTTDYSPLASNIALVNSLKLIKQVATVTAFKKLFQKNLNINL